MDPLDYMVEDCWLHLFNFLSAEDKQALCQTSETFHAMLQPQKTQWAFGLILPHIVKYLSGPRIQQIVQSLPFRLVCKSWRAGVDKCCASREYNKYFYIGYSFPDVAILEKFLNFFKDHQGNPFIRGGVAINVISSRYDKENSEVEEESVNDGGNAEMLNQGRKWMRKFRELEIKLLKRFGKEIESLSLDQKYYRSQIEYCSEEDAWKFLQLVLCNTPNLQRLGLDLRPLGYTYPCIPAESPDSLETAVTEYFTYNPLPNLPNLRELRLRRNNSKLETLLLEAYGQRLETLLTYCPSEIPSALWGNMNWLRELTLYDSDVNSSEEILRAIQSPLQILHCLYDQRCGERENSNQFFIDKFLLAVQHLPLKNVTVQTISTIVKEADPFPDDFPRHGTIETLNLEFLSRLESISLNFLLFLPHLKDLVVAGAKFHYRSILRQLK